MIDLPGFAEKFRLNGKTAVVTGAVGILGRYFCAGLAEFGANLAITDLDEEACSEFAKELERRYSITAAGISCDITSEDAIAGMVARVVERFGQINILHNNVGGKSPDLDAHFAPFESYSLAEWKRVMDINLDGVFLVDKAVGRQMVEQGRGGSIIHTGSIYGALAPDQRIYAGSQYLGRSINCPAIYSASKAGVIGLTRYLATYWAQYGIRVNCISPGGVESGQNEMFKKNYSNRVPLGRMARAEEMVGALIYLASDASSYVTGQNIMVDGGLSAW